MINFINTKIWVYFSHILCPSKIELVSHQKATKMGHKFKQSFEFWIMSFISEAYSYKIYKIYKKFGKVFVQMRVALKYEIKTNCQQVGYILFHFVGRRRHQGMITIKLDAQQGK